MMPFLGNARGRCSMEGAAKPSKPWPSTLRISHAAKHRPVANVSTGPTRGSRSVDVTGRELTGD